MTTKDKAVEVKEPTMQDLMQLVLSNKANAEQKKALSRLLEQSANDESKEELQGKITRIKEAIEKEGLTLEEFINASAEPKQPIFVYIDKEKNSHEVFGPIRGKAPSWLTQMKTSLTQEQAEEFALNADGKAWVKKIYTPK